MKKKILIFVSFAILAFTTTFAGVNKDISTKAQENFDSRFARASNVSWEKENTYYKASFTMNGQSLYALLFEEGDLIAVSRNILPTSLPVNLQLLLTKNFSAYWVTELVEYALDNETLYFITVENADQKILLENAGANYWSLVKKTVK